MGLPVVTVASGGLPVVDVGASLRGTPVTEVASGMGVRVTKVAAYGLPVAYETIGVAAPMVAATLNGASSGVTLSNGNLTAAYVSGSAAGGRSASLKNTGKYYFETTIGQHSNTGSSNDCVGVLLSSGTYVDFLNGTNSAMARFSTGGIFSNNAASGKNMGVAVTADVVGSAIDLDNRRCWFRKGAAGLWNGLAIGSANPATNVGGDVIAAGSFAPAVGFNWIAGDSQTANFGAAAFSGAVPAGFTAGWPDGGAAPLSISGTPVTTGTEYEHGVGSAYAGFSVTASAGTPPYTYSIASGALPPGITLNSSTGAVSGTPAFESAGTYAGIVVRVTDNVAATANLASFTLTIAFKDPYYSNVNFLLDYDAANASTVFTDQKSGSGMSVRDNTQHSTVVAPLYGTSSFLFDGAGDTLSFADSALWDLAASNFTLDFTARPTSVSGVKFWFGHWGSTPNLSWIFYQNNDTVELDVSTTGSDTLTQVASAAATLVVNTWARWRLDFDGTKYRLYKNGVMIASSTTVRTIFNAGVSQFLIGGVTTSFNFAGNCRGIRLTVGTARTASDSGYTISNRAFPTS